MLLALTTESPVEDHGSVILFTGTSEEGDDYRFAADRRPALDIIAALQSGYESEIMVDVDDWQIMGGPIRGTTRAT